MKIKYLFIAVILSLLTPMTVSASSICEEVNESGVNSCKVYAYQPSYYTIVIDKNIVLDNKTNEGTYYVKIKGDIAGNERIEVFPDSTVTFKQKGKSDIYGTVSQERTSFKIGDGFVTEENLKEGIETEGKIYVDKLGSGEWKAYFNFNIKLYSDENVTEEYVL